MQHSVYRDETLMNQTHVVPTATGKYSECEISKRSFVVYRAVCKRAKIRHKGSQGVAVRFGTDTVGGWNGLTTCPNSLAPLESRRVRGYDACHVGCPKTAAHSWSKAVLHIYYYAPKTLEITYVDSYLFKDEDACKNAIGAALQIAMPYTGMAIW